MAIISLSNLFPSSFLNDTAIHKSLGEEFSLCEKGSMVFHWADFHETCDTIRSHMEADPSLHEDFKRREAAILGLTQIPVWIRTQRKVHQMTMHELYERYIMNRSHLVGGIDPFGPIEISFISATGPFKAMTIAECFNKLTYRDFVLINLLKGKLPRRDFRIRLQSRVLVEYGPDFENAKLVNLEQMTSKGLLFSVDSDFFIKELSQCSTMRFLIDTEILRSGKGKNLAELKAHLGQHTFNLMYSSRKEDAIECSLKSFSTQSSFDFFKNKRVYLFTVYENLASSNPRAAEDMQHFVSYGKELVREHYRQLSEKIRTA